MDRSLGPAFQQGNVIEIFGEAGSGKSQFCLDLALQTTAHSPHGRVLFIVTDRSFPARRMTQLLEHTDLSPNHLDRIVVKSVWESKAFFEVLENNVPEMAKIMQLDLIVIDSIAGALRSEFESNQRDFRAHSVHKLGVILNKMARGLSIPIVVTNQVTAVIDQKQENFGRQVLPCLGLSWTCYVHTRLFVAKTGMTVQCDQLNLSKRLKIETSVRVVEVDFCPFLCNSVMHFIVDNAGIRAITINRK